MICSMNKCKNEAVNRYSPDLDIEGLKACAEHDKTVKLAYICILQGTPEIADDILGTAKPRKDK